MNPGSDEARASGCVCAVLDNGHGRHPYMGWNEDGTGNWSVRGDCPLHGFDDPCPKSAVITPGDGRGQDGTGVVTVHSSNGPADRPKPTSDACPCEPATNYRCPKHEHRAMSRRFGADPYPSGNADG